MQDFSYPASVRPAQSGGGITLRSEIDPKGRSCPYAGLSRPRRTTEQEMGRKRYEKALKNEHRSLEAEQWEREFLYRLLYEAYKEARVNGRNSYAQMRFERNLSSNLWKLCHELLNRTYRPSRCVIFIVDSPVKREVIAPAFRDQVVDHLLHGYLSPIFEREFIYDSYSCRKGKGTDFGVDRLAKALRSATENYSRPAWVLQGDLSGYFMSIDHNLLYDEIISTLKKKGHDKDVFYPLAVYLTRVIIYTDPTVGCILKGSPFDWVGLPKSKSYFFCAPGTGLPIGKLTSQLFSNIMLNPFDNWVKRDLKARWYGRYVDDFWIIARERMLLLFFVGLICNFLQERLNLRLHPHKIRLTRADLKIGFLGVKVGPRGWYMTERSEELMADRLAMDIVREKNEYLLDAKLSSCRGHLKRRRSVRVQRLLDSWMWGR